MYGKRDEKKQQNRQFFFVSLFWHDTLIDTISTTQAIIFFLFDDVETKPEYKNQMMMIIIFGQNKKNHVKI